MGPARIAGLLKLSPSTVHRVLVRYRTNRLAHMDRATRRVIRRYEYPQPGGMVHVDIKKLGNIPDGGGHKVHGRATGGRHNTCSRPIANNSTSSRTKLGYAYLHTALDDHSRLAYTEILPDEPKTTATAFWKRAHAWFAVAGIDIQRVLTDNGACHPTGPRPTAQSSVSTASCSTNGPTVSPTAPRPNGAPPCPAGYTTTTITATTPASAAHPPAAYPTSQFNTTSDRRESPR
ncbi:hypothetical protein GCM10027597_26290 [Saccharopolyspora tripterygii]